ncbi:MAG: response regulator transcription factor [Actinobacteria bacterium]|nr:response regulator transcription factor [Actinomycetota bacterium]
MHEQQPIRVLIAEDYEIYRMVIVELLARHSDVEVVAEVGDGRSAIERTAELEPDVALLDHGLPRIGGVDLVRAVRECCPRTRIVMMSGYVDELREAECVAAGAVACVLKGATGEDVYTTIMDAMSVT